LVARDEFASALLHSLARQRERPPHLQSVHRLMISRCLPTKKIPGMRHAPSTPRMMMLTSTLENTYKITRIAKSGKPVNPKTNIMKWGNVLVAIVHENCGINLKSIRGREKKHRGNLLLAKMRDIFKFNNHDMARAKRHVMLKFTPAFE
jgi:hypothetical protein